MKYGGIWSIYNISLHGPESCIIIESVENQINLTGRRG